MAKLVNKELNISPVGAVSVAEVSQIADAQAGMSVAAEADADAQFRTLSLRKSTIIKEMKLA